MSGGVQSVGSNIAFGTTDLAHRVAADILAAQFLQKTTDTQKQQSKALGAWRGSSKSGVELFVYYQQQQKEREPERIPRPLHIERVQVLPHETVGQIKLRLKSKPAFTSSSVLIMGDRELAEHEVVEQVVSNSLQGSTNGERQVVVKLKDVESLTVSTEQGEVIFKRREDFQQNNNNNDTEMLQRMPKPPSLLTLALAEQSEQASSLNTSQDLSQDITQQSSEEYQNNCQVKKIDYLQLQKDLQSKKNISDADAPELNRVESTEEVDCCQMQEDLKVRGQFCRGGDSNLNVQCMDWSEVMDQAVVHLVVHNSNSKFHASADGEYFELTVSSGQSVGDFARQIAVAKGLQDVQHKLYLNGQELSASKSLKDFGISEGSVLELVPTVQNYRMGIDMPLGSPPLTDPSHQLFAKFSLAKKGLASGKLPELAASGSGGSYFFKDPQGACVAVFKPEDEEPMAEHNPRGFISSSENSSSDSNSNDGLRRGIRPGEGAVREVIAFLLDHHHFSGVPPTALVNLVAQDQGVKVGSLQGFVEADGDCEERGTSVFPVHEVHKIAVLDIRLGNTDRNAGNILAKKNCEGDWKLTPIDHGYCLPDSFEDINFEWMYWRQAEQPFSPQTKAYINTIDIEKDLQLIRAHNLQVRPECERVLQVCTMLLKKGAARNLTPYDIASILCREYFTQSPIEKLDHEAHRVAKNNQNGNGVVQYGLTQQQVYQKIYLKQMDTLLDEYLDDVYLQTSNEDLPFM